MKKSNFYDIFFVAALILAVADNKSIYTLLILIVASALELFSVVQGVLKIWRKEG